MYLHIYLCVTIEVWGLRSSLSNNLIEGKIFLILAELSKRARALCISSNPSLLQSISLNFSIHHSHSVWKFYLDGSRIIRSCREYQVALSVLWTNQWSNLRYHWGSTSPLTSQLSTLNSVLTGVLIDREKKITRASK